MKPAARARRRACLTGGAALAVAALVTPAALAGSSSGTLPNGAELTVGRHLARRRRLVPRARRATPRSTCRCRAPRASPPGHRARAGSTSSTSPAARAWLRRHPHDPHLREGRGEGAQRPRRHRRVRAGERRRGVRGRGGDRRHAGRRGRPEVHVTRGDRRRHRRRLALRRGHRPVHRQGQSGQRLDQLRRRAPGGRHPGPGGLGQPGQRRLPLRRAVERRHPRPVHGRAHLGDGRRDDLPVRRGGGKLVRGWFGRHAQRDGDRQWHDLHPRDRTRRTCRTSSPTSPPRPSPASA